MALWSGNQNPFLTRLRRSTSINDADVAELETLFEGDRRVAAHVDLFLQRERPDRIHILLDGWACRYRLLAQGQRQITMLLLPGDVCDLDALYVQRLDHTLATVSPSVVAALDLARLRDLATRRPGIALALGWLAVVENASLMEHNASLGRRQARERMAHLLCELLVRMAAVGRVHDNTFALPLTQEELGDVLGLSAVHVNRVLQALRGDGLISHAGRDLTIHDWDALSALAEFRPDYLHIAAEGSDAAHGPFHAPWGSAARREE